MIDQKLINELFKKLQDEEALIVFAESLTGGLISSEFSKIPGASSVFWGSYVVYSTFAKERILEVPRAVIDNEGVVSSPCAYYMACGALGKSFGFNEDYPTYSLAATGMAGPSSSDPKIKVGTVYLAVAKLRGCKLGADCPALSIYCKTNSCQFQGSRNSVREQTLNFGVKMLLELIDECED